MNEYHFLICQWDLPWKSHWRGRLSTTDLFALTKSAPFLLKICVNQFYKTSYLNEEVIRTEPSVSFRIRWSYLSVHLSEVFKGGIEVFPENWSHATSNAIEDGIHLGRKGQPVVEIPAWNLTLHFYSSQKNSILKSNSIGLHHTLDGVTNPK